MPELCISIALVAVGGMLWDAARRWMTLAHGRMLSADKSQTFERALTQLDTLSKLQTERADDIQNSVNDAHARIDRDIAAHVEALAKVAAWEQKAEATFEKQQAEIARYDGALVNLTEEVVKLQQQQVMALQGVVNLPKHGYQKRTP